jgi:hypothetical protein
MHHRCRWDNKQEYEHALVGRECTALFDAAHGGADASFDGLDVSMGTSPASLVDCASAKRRITASLTARDGVFGMPIDYNGADYTDS